jgi:hypothetical protein
MFIIGSPIPDLGQGGIVDENGNTVQEWQPPTFQNQMGITPDEGIYNTSDFNWDTVEGYMEGLLSSMGKLHNDSMKYNSAEAAANRQFQREESQLQRNWYEEMSNTAYQRAMADMRKAGLNPILAYSQGGAATSPTGISAGSAASINSPGGDTLTSVLSAIADLFSAASGSALNIGKLKTKSTKGRIGF